MQLAIAICEFLSIALVAIFISQLLCVNIYASDIQDGEVSFSSNETDLLVKHRDGTEERITPKIRSSEQLASLSQQQYDAYIPEGLEIAENFNQQSSISPQMSARSGRIANNLTPVDAKKFPYTTICYLLATFNEETTGSTAFLLGPDLVLTAAHSVFDTTTNTWGTNVRLFFDVNDRTRAPFTTKFARPVSTAIQQQYADSKYNTNQYDWAILQIDNPLGKTQGYLGFHGCSSQENNKTNMSAIGYPIDGTVHVSNQMEKSVGSFYTVEGNCMRYRMFVCGGMSGGPTIDNDFSVYTIICYESTSDEDPFNGGGYMFGDYLFSMVVDARADSIARWP